MTSTAKRKILIVDDDAIFRTNLKEILTAFGFDVMEAQNGSEALTLLQSTSVQLILSDLDMPIKNGIDFLREFRVFNQNTPVILMSGNASPDKQTLNSLGIFCFLQKPFSSINDLLSLVGKWCSHPDLNGDLRFRKP